MLRFSLTAYGLNNQGSYSKLHSKEYFQQAFGTRPRRQASSDESVHQYAEEQRSAADKGIVLNANWS